MPRDAPPPAPPTRDVDVERARSLGDVFGRRSDVGVEELSIPFEQPFAEGVIERAVAVSYTHLTLPTKA